MQIQYGFVSAQPLMAAKAMELYSVIPPPGDRVHQTESVKGGVLHCPFLQGRLARGV